MDVVEQETPSTEKGGKKTRWSDFYEYVYKEYPTFQIKILTS